MMNNEASANPVHEAAEKLAAEYGALRLQLIRTRLELNAADRAATHYASENDQLRRMVTQGAQELQYVRDELARLVAKGAKPQ